MLILSVDCFGLTNITINNTFTTNTTILPFGAINSISSLSVNGSLNLSCDSSLLRVILVDKNSKEYMIYEAYGMIVNSMSFSFSNKADETALLFNVVPTSIKIIVRNASITISTFIVDQTVLTSSQSSIETQRNANNTIVNNAKIAILNQQIANHCMNWKAGITSLSQNTFENRLISLETSDNYLSYGYEYYKSGAFSMPIYQNCSKLKSGTDNSILYEFDWRNKHNACQPNSSYYKAGDSIGWLTPIKGQGSICGSCWCFSTVGTLELYTNLYFNRHLDFDLSEQEVLSCSHAGTCAGGDQNSSLAWVVKNGLVSEATFPYVASNIPCPLGLISIVKPPYSNGIGIINSDNLKKSLVKFGPLNIGVNYPWGKLHAMVLIGWQDLNDGTFNWIFKNSTCTGSIEYWNVISDKLNQIIIEASTINNIIPQQAMVVTNYSESDRVCVDIDGDGYYNWGIGSKPISCPACAPDIEDQNDADASYAQTDAYGKAILPFTAITPIITNITSSQIWNIPTFLCGDLDIKNNSILTVSITPILMQASHKIYVESGSTLTINGGKTTLAGIEVKAGGTLNLINYGIIEIVNPANLIIDIGGVFNESTGGAVNIVKPFAAK